MKKIAEMTMAELSVCLCKMASPASRIFSDGAVSNAFEEMKDQMGEKTSAQRAFSLFMSILHPVLMGEKHAEDTYAILAALEEKSIEEIKAYNGLEMMRDLFKVFVLEGDVQSIFRPGAEVQAE